MAAAPPPWFSRLPVVAGRGTVVVDNNVLSTYLFDAVTPEAVRALFEQPGVRRRCGRQVIDEALNHPGLDVARRRVAWERVAQLQAEGEVVLSGATQMTPAMRAVYEQLAGLLTAARVSAEDARVFADALVKRVPVFTLDLRALNALAAALNNPAVRRCLASHGLPTALADVVVG